MKNIYIYARTDSTVDHAYANRTTASKLYGWTEAGCSTDGLGPVFSVLTRALSWIENSLVHWNQILLSLINLECKHFYENKLNVDPAALRKLIYWQISMLLSDHFALGWLFLCSALVNIQCSCSCKSVTIANVLDARSIFMAWFRGRVKWFRIYCCIKLMGIFDLVCNFWLIHWNFVTFRSGCHVPIQYDGKMCHRKMRILAIMAY